MCTPLFPCQWWLLCKRPLISAHSFAKVALQLLHSGAQLVVGLAEHEAHEGARRAGAGVVKGTDWDKRHPRLLGQPVAELQQRGARAGCNLVVALRKAWRGSCC